MQMSFRATCHLGHDGTKDGTRTSDLHRESPESVGQMQEITWRLPRFSPVHGATQPTSPAHFWLIVRLRPTFGSPIISRSGRQNAAWRPSSRLPEHATTFLLFPRAFGPFSSPASALLPQLSLLPLCNHRFSVEDPLAWPLAIILHLRPNPCRPWIALA